MAQRDLDLQSSDQLLDRLCYSAIITIPSQTLCFDLGHDKHRGQLLRPLGRTVVVSGKPGRRGHHSGVCDYGRDETHLLCSEVEGVAGERSEREQNVSANPGRTLLLRRCSNMRLQPLLPTDQGSAMVLGLQAHCGVLWHLVRDLLPRWSVRRPVAEQHHDPAREGEHHPRHGRHAQDRGAQLHDLAAWLLLHLPHLPQRPRRAHPIRGSAVLPRLVELHDRQFLLAFMEPSRPPVHGRARVHSHARRRLQEEPRVGCDLLLLGAHARAHRLHPLLQLQAPCLRRHDGTDPAD
mmetsp:Transcript_1134/g.2220  ORF Transcript_1134/g.2220 Transcript_1134/m.2220 type:complete len:293 (+) Transcript_1134:416-1294(+)